jgi:hypothetical protein
MRPFLHPYLRTFFWLVYETLFRLVYESFFRLPGLGDFSVLLGQDKQDTFYSTYVLCLTQSKEQTAEV